MEKNNLAALALAAAIAVQSPEAEAVDNPDVFTLQAQILANTTDTNPTALRLGYQVRVDEIFDFLDEPVMEFAGNTVDHNTGVMLQADFQQGLTLTGEWFSLTAGGEVGAYGLITSETTENDPVPMQGVGYVAGNASLYTNGMGPQFLINGRLEHAFEDHLQTGDGVDYQTHTVPSLGATLLFPLGDDAKNDSNLGPTVTWYPTDNGPMPALALTAALNAKF